MENKDDFRKLLQRARWDRLLGALAVLLLLILLIVLLVSACGKKTTPAAVDSVIPPATTQPTTEAVVDNSMAVFLSPSTQEDNVYACDSTVTEESAMFDLAEEVKKLLEADGYTVYMCAEDDGVEDKVKTGNELKCGAYVALHTNSGGESGNGEGTECYYSTKIPGSKELAQNIYNRVAELTPTDDRGLKDEKQRDLYEIKSNAYPCCLLEVEFHDMQETSRWILDNTEGTAKAIKDGIVAYLLSQQTADTTEAAETADPTQDTTSAAPSV